MTPEERARKIAPSFFIGGALQDELADAIANALRTARNEVLEEAAEVAEATSATHDTDIPVGFAVATAIRALKGE